MAGSLPAGHSRTGRPGARLGDQAAPRTQWTRAEPNGGSGRPWRASCPSIRRSPLPRTLLGPRSASASRSGCTSCPSVPSRGRNSALSGGAGRKPTGGSHGADPELLVCCGRTKNALMMWPVGRCREPRPNNLHRRRGRDNSHALRPTRTGRTGPEARPHRWGRASLCRSGRSPDGMVRTASRRAEPVARRKDAVRRRASSTAR